MTISMNISKLSCMSGNRLGKVVIREMPKGSADIGDAELNADSMDMNQQKRIRFSQDTKHRRQLVIWMMCVVSAWLLIVLFIVVFNGILKLSVSDNVMITLLATTTVNVLGLANIILNGLFGGSRPLFQRRK